MEFSGSSTYPFLPFHLTIYRKFQLIGVIGLFFAENIYILIYITFVHSQFFIFTCMEILDNTVESLKVSKRQRK